MSTSPFRLSSSILASLRNLAKASGLSMSDWIRDRIAREDELGHAEPSIPLGPPSLFRDVWVLRQQSGPIARDSMRAKILEGLREHAYTFSEVGLDKLTPLHWAARGEGDLELVVALVDAGHPVSPEDCYSNTPAVLAIAEQNRETESNLQIIEFLLGRTRDRDLFPQATLFLHGDGMYDYSLDKGMFQTAECIRSRFKRANLEAMLHNLPGWYLPRRCARVLYYQGHSWPEIYKAMVARGIDADRAQFEMRCLGVWAKYFQDLKLEGLEEEKAIQALRELGATWADIAWAYFQNHYPPEEILRIILPLAPSESHVGVVANALSVEDRIPLLDARDALETLGLDPRALVARTPFTEEKKDSLLRRMRLA